MRIGKMMQLMEPMMIGKMMLIVRIGITKHLKC